VDEEDESTAELKASYSKREPPIMIRNQLKQKVKPEEVKVEEPVLEPVGVIDCVCVVVGARDIGDQKADHGGQLCARILCTGAVPSKRRLLC